MNRNGSLSSRGPASSPHPHPNRDAPDLSWPDTIAGWTRISQDRYQVTYWKASSSHVHGAYTRIGVFNRSDSVAITRSAINQFGGTVSKTTLGTISQSNAELLRSTVQAELEQSPGDGTVTDIPQLPQELSTWHLETETSTGSVGTVCWAHADTDASLSVVQTENAHTYASQRPSTVRYTGELPYTAADSEAIVEGVPRTAALEIAVNTLSTLSAPISSCTDLRSELKDVTGIGTAKARRLLLVGITSPTELRAVLNGKWSVNHHWEEAVRTIVTPTIRSAFDTESTRE